MTVIHCERCIHWKRGPNGVFFKDTEGQCRRFPPVPLALDGQLQRAWPKTMWNDWCGEHKEKTT